MKYIVCKQFKKKGIDGNFNLPKNSTCNELGNLIFHNQRPICFKTSQDAYNYFSRDDDGKGEERFGLVHDILDLIAEYVMDYNDARMNGEKDIEDKASAAYDTIREHYPQFLKNGMDVFTVEFYNAEIEELEAVKNLI